MSFCPRCGKPTEHQFCQACLREIKPLITKMKHVSAVMCPSCNRTLTTRWSTKPLQEVVEAQLERNVTYQQGARITGIVLEEVAIETGNQELQLTVIGSADEESADYEEQYIVAVYIDGRRCTECDNLANQYFTGILQLRNPNDEIETEIERLLGRALSSIKDVTGGIDYYVTDHRILQNVARQIHSNFGGELTIRAQHFSYDSLASKNLYRVNACIRVPKWWRGSVIQAATKNVLITNLGKRLKGIDLENGKVVSVASKNEYPAYDTESTTVVTTRPSVTVLDPQTYQTTTVQNPDIMKTEPGQTITVVRIDEKIYLVPS